MSFSAVYRVGGSKSLPLFTPETGGGSRAKNRSFKRWEAVFDADTNALTRHAQEVIEFFHHPLSEIQVKLMLTGSATDEMFPKGHYEKLFGDICAQTKNAKYKLFMQGTHPAMMSNLPEFVDLVKQFCSV